MKLGLTCPRFTWPGGDTAIAERFAAVARGADEAGLHSLWVMDHFFQIPNFGAVEDPMLEAYGTLSYAAALTGRVTLGTLVTGAVYRERGLLVKQVSTLDALSGGRAVLGLGAGWYEQEARALGLRFPSLAERFERLEETLQIAKQMWSDEDKRNEGSHYKLERTLNAPQARPPILIGGSGEKKTLRLVAEYADACNLLHGANVQHKLEYCAPTANTWDGPTRKSRRPSTCASPTARALKRASSAVATWPPWASTTSSSLSPTPPPTPRSRTWRRSPRRSPPSPRPDAEHVLGGRAHWRPRVMGGISVRFVQIYPGSRR
jgi:F420-dependent oxidoreductase-like protein